MGRSNHWFLVLFFTFSTAATLGWGYSLDGPSATIKADGTSQQYNLAGYNGSNGSSGSPGMVASCTSDGISESGGNGTNGSDGEDGGNGGNVVAYYQDIANLAKVLILDTHGAGGYGGSGGVSGIGCNGGGPGVNGSSGSDGRNGAYGEILLIPQLQPLPASVPAVEVAMTKMTDAPIAVSKNFFTEKNGARGLFAPGSDISEVYYLFQKRVEANVSFRWAANRPLSDFSNFSMVVGIDKNGKFAVRFPQGFLVDGEIQSNGNNITYVVHAALTTSEVSQLTLDSLNGHDTTLTITVDDLSKVSDIVHNQVTLTYYAYDTNQYKLVFNQAVPSTALKVSATGLQVSLSQLGIDPNFLKANTFVYVGLAIQRGFTAASQTINLGNYFQIAAFSVGDLVVTNQAATLYSGSTPEGQLTKGDKFKVAEIQGQWVLLQKIDGTALGGWIQTSQISAP